jgi:hypothetical protein
LRPQDGREYGSRAEPLWQLGYELGVASAFDLSDSLALGLTFLTALLRLLSTQPVLTLGALTLGRGYLGKLDAPSRREARPHLRRRFIGVDPAPDQRPVRSLEAVARGDVFDRLQIRSNAGVIKKLAPLADVGLFEEVEEISGCPDLGPEHHVDHEPAGHRGVLAVEVSGVKADFDEAVAPEAVRDSNLPAHGRLAGWRASTGILSEPSGCKRTAGRCPRSIARYTLLVDIPSSCAASTGET